MKDRTWKVADFGLTCEATSTALLFTDFSRGTPGYRAPELLKEMHVGYNNKIDIWAMGCILFEIATGQKPFVNDTMVTEYSRGGSPLEIRCDLITGQDGEEFISSSIRDSFKLSRLSDPLLLIFANDSTNTISWLIKSTGPQPWTRVRRPEGVKKLMHTINPLRHPLKVQVL
jgi:serine/threonine protein kinase